jgi:hypothetical protein
MQLTIISKYFLSYESVDSVSSLDLIKALKKRTPNLNIHIVTSNNTYKNTRKSAAKNSLHEDLGEIHLVGSVYNGTNRLLQFIAALIDGFRLVFKARNLPVENIICQTNPPLVSVWYALLLQKKKWCYWSFDLYPDAIQANKLVSADNSIYQLVDRLVYKYPPKFLVSLGEKQRDYLMEKYRKDIPHTILPCGILSGFASKQMPHPQWYQKDKKYIGYLGNVGKAHSKDFITAVIDNLDYLTGFTLVLAIYGEHKIDIENFVKNKNSGNILLLNSVERCHLSLIDIHMVSLLTEWTNISVPSKAVSAVSSGSALLFHGSPQSDTWNMFNQCSFYAENIREIPTIFSHINETSLALKKNEAVKTAKHLLQTETQAYDQITQFLYS